MDVEAMGLRKGRECFLSASPVFASILEEPSLRHVLHVHPPTSFPARLSASYPPFGEEPDLGRDPDSLS